MPTGQWEWVTFDAAEVVATGYGSAADLVEIDAIAIQGWGETRVAELALLGVTHASYSAYGESLADPRTGDVLSPLSTAAAWARHGAGTRLGWQSKEFDPALGLFHNHARWYSPSAGRFTQASLMGWTFEHLYGYGENSPHAMTDINGLSGSVIGGQYQGGTPGSGGETLWDTIPDGSHEDDGWTQFQDMIDSRAEANADMMMFGYGPLYDYAPCGYNQAEFE